MVMVNERMNVVVWIETTLSNVVWARNIIFYQKNFVLVDLSESIGSYADVAS